MASWNQSEAAKTRTKEVWARLLDCFGDALLRKFPGKEPPTEWVTGIAMLKPPQVERAFRRMLGQGMASPPSLPAFMRLARALGNDEDEDGAPPPPPLLSGPDMDAWEMEANRRLLGYLRAEVARASDRYGPAASYDALRIPRELLDEVNVNRRQRGRVPLDPHTLDADPRFVRNVQRLVQAKKAWAADMRDLAQNDPLGRVPSALAIATWTDYFGSAEAAMEEPPPEATGAPA